MSILVMLALAQQQPSSCFNAPTVDSVVNTVDTLGTCMGDNWHTEWLMSATGELKYGQKYYWAIATNAAGDNWAGAQSGGTTYEHDHLIGTDGPGPVTQKWIKVRCGVVPAGTTPVGLIAKPQNNGVEPC